MGKEFLIKILYSFRYIGNTECQIENCPLSTLSFEHSCTHDGRLARLQSKNLNLMESNTKRTPDSVGVEIVTV
jgi:hypothetical protein